MTLTGFCFLDFILLEREHTGGGGDDPRVYKYKQGAGSEREGEADSH